MSAQRLSRYFMISAPAEANLLAKSMKLIIEKYKHVVAGSVGGCYNPKATLWSLALFPAEAARPCAQSTRQNGSSFFHITDPI